MLKATEHTMQRTIEGCKFYTMVTRRRERTANGCLCLVGGHTDEDRRLFRRQARWAKTTTAKETAQLTEAEAKMQQGKAYVAI